MEEAFSAIRKQKLDLGFPPKSQKAKFCRRDEDILNWKQNFYAQNIDDVDFIVELSILSRLFALRARPHHRDVDASVVFCDELFLTVFLTVFNGEIFTIKLYTHT